MKSVICPLIATFALTACTSLEDYPRDNPADALAVIDSDGDGVINRDDAFPDDPNETRDTDNDGVGDNGDNCPELANEDQVDADADDIGDACDPCVDADGDGYGIGDSCTAPDCLDNNNTVTDIVCSDGIKCDSEVCDDGEQTANCEADCTLPTCGDDVLNELAGEVCDDGNTDDCSGTCLGDCSAEVTLTGCGDGATCDAEACDDGNTIDGDYCSSDCSAITGECGEGVLQDNESCDDNNDTAEDGCSDTCQMEFGWTCDAPGQACFYRAYVDLNATGAEDGTTWTDAFVHLADALDVAADKHAGAQNAMIEVWVAQGVYHPDRGTDRTLGDRNTPFAITRNASVYGGFAGGETALDQRDTVANLTVLSGDLLDDDATTGNAENSRYLVMIDNIVGEPLIDENTRLDGFTIEGVNIDQVFMIGAVTIGPGSPVVSDCIFEDNVSVSAGVVRLYNSSVTFRDSVFRNNEADLGAGAVFIIDAHPEVAPLASRVRFTGCTFEGNRVLGTDDQVPQGGGAIGMGSQGTSTELFELEILDSTFTSNYVEGHSIGGGAIMVEPRGEVLIRDSTFATNDSIGAGGAILFASLPSNSSVRIEDTGFDTNSADDDGGAIQIRSINNDSTAHFDTVQFVNNSAGGNGGAMQLQSSPTFPPVIRAWVLDCIFSGNQASSGGALDLDAVVDMEGATIFDNTATDTGGAIAVGGVLLLKNSRLFGNFASQDGGAIYSPEATGVGAHPGNAIVGSILAGNSAGRDGGAVHLVNGWIIANSTIVGNSAGSEGGGLYFPTTSMQFGTNVINTIVWDNSAGVSGTEQATETASIPTVVVANSCVAGGFGVSYFELTAANLDPCNPGLVDPDGPDDTMGTEDDDLQLLVTSDCVDAGFPHEGPDVFDLNDDGDVMEMIPVTDYVETDVLGNSRESQTIDIGAVEYQH